jgi:hypothetical protein
LKEKETTVLKDRRTAALRKNNSNTANLINGKNNGKKTIAQITVSKTV